MLHKNSKYKPYIHICLCENVNVYNIDRRIYILIDNDGYLGGRGGTMELAMFNFFLFRRIDLKQTQKS